MDAAKVSRRSAVALQAIGHEFHEATQKFRPFASGHEGWAVISEELDELWEAVKADDMTQAREEAVQVGAMALRFLVDLEDGGNPAEREWKP